MQLRGVIIEDTFAEAFRMWAARLIVTAVDPHWVRVAAAEVCGYATSVIGCDTEAGVERILPPDETPDGRPGAALLFFAFNADKLAKALPNRVGQSLMTCPTTAVYDGLPGVVKTDDSARLDLGNRLRFFGDGHQKSKVIAGRRYWRIPVMDGEFTVEDACGAVKAIAGGNILICGRDQAATLAAALRAADAIAPLPGVIAPFPGGVVRSGSKVGSRYKALFASTNDAFCPTLRGKSKSVLRAGVGCVYEIVINGLTKEAIAAAMRASIQAACGDGVIAISAGNYGGNLGKFHFKLHEVCALPPSPPQADAREAGEGAPGRSGSAHWQIPSNSNIPSPQPAPQGQESRGYALTWKPGAPLPADGSFLRPDTLGPLDRLALAATPVRTGRGESLLGDLFDIAGQPGETMTLRGLPRLPSVGARMGSGELVIDGDAGDDLGASMSGGIIRVHGSAGHRTGGPTAAGDRGMTGGEIVIDGDASDFVGIRMRRGLIAVRGRAGRSPGFRMLAGTIVLGRGPLDHAGLEMRRGTLLLLDPSGELPAAGAGAFIGGPPLEADAAPVLRLILRRLMALGWDCGGAMRSGCYAPACGDRFELNKGEVWQWRS